MKKRKQEAADRQQCNSSQKRKSVIVNKPIEYNNNGGK